MGSMAKLGQLARHITLQSINILIATDQICHWIKVLLQIFKSFSLVILSRFCFIYLYNIFKVKQLMLSSAAISSRSFHLY